MCVYIACIDDETEFEFALVCLDACLKLLLYQRIHDTHVRALLTSLFTLFFSSHSCTAVKQRLTVFFPAYLHADMYVRVSVSVTHITRNINYVSEVFPSLLSACIAREQSMKKKRKPARKHDDDEEEESESGVGASSTQVTQYFTHLFDVAQQLELKLAHTRAAEQAELHDDAQHGNAHIRRCTGAVARC